MRPGCCQLPSCGDWRPRGWRKHLSKVFCGIDWAEGHYDIALVDQDGSQLAKLRISDDSAGFHALMQGRHGGAWPRHGPGSTGRSAGTPSASRAEDRR
ncbi:transposase [Streptomyces sp. N2A]|uniref:IS110 family transposase n=1 Tax=Streptomyces sp. N2A TaxID=3073936 RepID=UPI0037D9B92E